MRLLIKRAFLSANAFLPQVKNALPFPVYRWVMRSFFSSIDEYGTRPHRLWIENEMLPRFAAQKPARLIFVGTAPYTWHYERIFRHAGTDYITVDPLPAARVWGSSHHFVAGVEELPRMLARQSVDIVVMIGVYGFGLTNDEQLHHALVNIHALLKPSGFLVLSWNNDVSPDPSAHPDLNALYRRAQVDGMPERKTFESSLVVDFYQTLQAAST